MQDYVFSLNAGETKRFSVVGNTLRYKSGSGAVAAQANGGTVSLLPGQQITDMSRRYSEFSIKNTGASVISGVIIAGDIDFKDDQFVGVVSVSNVNGPMVNTAKTVTNASAQLVAANASRRFLLIQNKDAAGNLFVTLDGTAATTANGIKIGSGSTLILDVFAPVGAIFAIGDVASNANIVVVEG